MPKKIDPEQSPTRHDKKSTPIEDSEDFMLKEKVEGNKNAKQIKEIAKKIEQGP